MRFTTVGIYLICYTVFIYYDWVFVPGVAFDVWSIDTLNYLSGYNYIIAFIGIVCTVLTTHIPRVEAAEAKVIAKMYLYMCVQILRNQ